MKEFILKVEGMSCSGCENRVQNALKNVEGVKEVIASYTGKTVKVTLQDNIAKEAIAEIIHDLGYDVIE